jgi:Rrf2 family protein
LRATVHLAIHAESPQRTAAIAESTKVPLAYLSKILQGLQRGQIVHLQRGIGGGVKLALSPDRLTVLDVVNAVDPIKRIKSCPLNLMSHGPNLCELHRRLDDSMLSIEESLGTTTLSELMKKSNPSPAICEDAEVTKNDSAFVPIRG